MHALVRKVLPVSSTSKPSSSRVPDQWMPVSPSISRNSRILDLFDVAMSRSITGLFSDRLQLTAAGAGRWWIGLQRADRIGRRLGRRWIEDRAVRLAQRNLNHQRRVRLLLAPLVDR